MPAEQTVAVMTITRTTPVANLPELLRVEEAAVWLDVSRGAVYELARNGGLGSVKLGRLLRITRDSLASKAKGAA